MISPVTTRHRAGGRVRALLDEGLPFGLSTLAAERFIERCDEALDELDTKLSLTYVRLLTAKCMATVLTGSCAGESYAQQAHSIAHELKDPVANAYALVAACITRSGPEHLPQRITSAEQILATADTVHDTDLVHAGYLILLVALLEQGDIRSIDTRLLDDRVRAAPDSKHSALNPARWFRCLRLLLDGDLTAAEQEAASLYNDAPTDGTLAYAIYTTQLGLIRWMRGEAERHESDLLAARRTYPDQALWDVSLAWTWLRQGRRAAAESLMRTLPEPDAFPRDFTWLATMTVTADIVRTIGNREQAMRVRELLLPYADRLASVGAGVAFWGTVARPLGLLEERLGLVEEARSHLELAVTMSARIGALAWHAEAQIELAQFALRHGIVDIASYDLLAEARATSEARGFRTLARRAMTRPRIRVLGGFEVVSLCGVRAEWTSKKARALLKMLVAARGVAVAREVFMDTLWPDESPSVLANRFSVAVNVIRRALDPHRLLPTQHHVVTEGDSVRLELEHLDVDLERFLTLASRSDQASRRAAIELYRGDAFSDELYADWAVPIRELALHARARLTDASEH